MAHRCSTLCTVNLLEGDRGGEGQESEGQGRQEGQEGQVARATEGHDRRHDRRGPSGRSMSASSSRLRWRGRARRVRHPAGPTFLAHLIPSRSRAPILIDARAAAFIQGGRRIRHQAISCMCRAASRGAAMTEQRCTVESVRNRRLGRLAIHPVAMRRPTIALAVAWPPSARSGQPPRGIAVGARSGGQPYRSPPTKGPDRLRG
jgi:hypothetical protein